MEELRSALQVAIHRAHAASREINRGPGGREIALVITKLQEALHWLGDAEAQKSLPKE